MGRWSSTGCVQGGVGSPPFDSIYHSKQSSRIAAACFLCLAASLHPAHTDTYSAVTPASDTAASHSCSATTLASDTAASDTCSAATPASDAAGVGS